MQDVKNFVTLTNQSGGMLDPFQILRPDSDYFVSVDPDPDLKFGSRGGAGPLLEI
jgi:hypothetical protein